jgi:hypothetical protein
MVLFYGISAAVKILPMVRYSRGASYKMCEGLRLNRTIYYDNLYLLYNFMRENATKRTTAEEHPMHDHIHEHHRDHTEAAGPTARQLLNYMQEHNEEHANELSRLADRLAGEGSATQAELIREGVALIRGGNAKVAEALASLEAKQEV